MTSTFIELSEEYSIYVIIEPSKTSIALQVADLGVNRFLKKRYEQEYTVFICSSNVTGKVFDDVERIGCVVRSTNGL